MTSSRLPLHWTSRKQHCIHLFSIVWPRAFADVCTERFQLHAVRQAGKRGKAADVLDFIVRRCKRVLCMCALRYRLLDADLSSFYRDSTEISLQPCTKPLATCYRCVAHWRMPAMANAKWLSWSLSMSNCWPCSASVWAAPLRCCSPFCCF